MRGLYVHSKKKWCSCLGMVNKWDDASQLINKQDDRWSRVPRLSDTSYSAGENANVSNVWFT